MSWRLYVDIGNSAVKYGARQDGEWVSYDYIDHLLNRGADDALAEAQETPPDMPVTPEEIVEELVDYLEEDGLNLQECTGIGVSSTSAQAAGLVKELGRIAPAPLKLVGTHLKPRVKTQYHRPSQIGADRWANVVAALELYGAPAVVIDAGTFLTSEVIDAEGTFIGGSIGVGMLPLSLGMALFSETLAKAMFEILPEDPPLIGRSTTEAVHMGLVLQMCAAADRFILEARKVVGKKAPAILTGGFAEITAEHMKTDVAPEPLLTLEGIRLLDHYA